MSYQEEASQKSSIIDPNDRYQPSTSSSPALHNGGSKSLSVSFNDSSFGNDKSENGLSRRMRLLALRKPRSKSALSKVRLRNLKEMKEKEKEADLMAARLDSRLEIVNMFLHKSLVDDSFLARKELNPWLFKNNSSLKHKWDFVHNMVTTQEMLVAIRDAKRRYAEQQEEEKRLAEEEKEQERKRTEEEQEEEKERKLAEEEEKRKKESEKEEEKRRKDGEEHLKKQQERLSNEEASKKAKSRLQPKQGENGEGKTTNTTNKSKDRKGEEEGKDSQQKEEDFEDRVDKNKTEVQELEQEDDKQLQSENCETCNVSEEIGEPVEELQKPVDVISIPEPNHDKYIDGNDVTTPENNPNVSQTSPLAASTSRTQRNNHKQVRGGTTKPKRFHAKKPEVGSLTTSPTTPTSHMTSKRRSRGPVHAVLLGSKHGCVSRTSMRSSFSNIVAFGSTHKRDRCRFCRSEPVIYVAPKKKLKSSHRIAAKAAEERIKDLNDIYVNDSVGKNIGKKMQERIQQVEEIMKERIVNFNCQPSPIKNGIVR